MDDIDRVIGITIKAYTERAVQDINNALGNIKRDVDKYVKKNQQLKKQVDEQTKALEKNTHALKHREEEIKKVTQKEAELDKITKGRIERLEKENQAYRKQTKARNDLDKAIEANRRKAIELEKEHQKKITENANHEAKRRDDEIRYSKEYMDNLHDQAIAENNLFEARLRYEDEISKARYNALQDDKQWEMERVRAAQESSAQIARIRENVRRTQLTGSSQDTDISGAPGRGTRQVLFDDRVMQSQRERDLSWNERLASSLSNTLAPALDKVKNGYDRLKDAREQADDWAGENDRWFQKLALSTGEQSKATKDLEWKLAKLGRTMLGLVIASVMIFMQSFASALTAVAAQAIALVGSIGAAAGAIGGTLVSAIAQAIPMLGIFAAAMQRMSLVQNAVSQFDLIQKQGPQDATQAADQAKQASDAIAEAQRNQKDATEELTQARADARRELEDLIAAEKEANLAMQDALLTQKESKQALEDAIQEGDVGGIDRAQLAVAQARLGVSGARTDKARAGEDLAKAQRQGIEGMDQVQAATDRLADANRALADAHDSAAQAATSQSSAEDALNYYLSQLTDSERKLYEAIVSFRKRLQNEFTPVTDNIIDAFTYGIKGAEKVLFNNKIFAALKNQSEAVKDSLKDLIDLVTSKRSISFWEDTIKQGTKNLEPLEDILRNVFRIFRSIAEGAAPVFHRLLKLIADETKGWSDSLKGNKSGIEDFFQNGLKHLKAWGRLLKAFLNLFHELMEVSGHSAIMTLDDLAGRLNDAASYLDENRKEARKFFNQTSETIGYLLDIIVAIGKEFVKSFSPESVHALAQILIDVFIPALGLAVRFMGHIAILFDSLPSWAKDVIKVATAFVFLKGTLGLIVGLAKAIIAPFGRLLTIGYGLIKLFPLMSVGLRALFIGTGIGALIVGVVFLLDQFGLLDDAWRLLKEGAEIAWNFLKKELGPTIEDLGKTFTLLWEDIRFVANKISKFFGGDNKVGNAIEDFVMFVVHLWKDVLVAQLKNVWEFFRDTFKNIAQVIKGVVNFIDDLIHGRWDELWGDFKDIVKGVFNQLLNILDFATQPFENAGKAIINALADGFKWAFNHIIVPVLNFIIDRINDTLNAIDFALPGEQFGTVAHINPIGQDAGGVDKATEEYVKNSKAKDENALATSRLNDTLLQHGQTEKANNLTTDKNTKSKKENTKETEGNTKANKDSEKQTEKTTKRTREQGDESRKTGKKVGVLSSSFLGAGKQAKELAENIRDATNKALKEFGAKELKFSVPEVSKMFSDVGGTVSGLFQSGGWFGNPNHRGPDDRLIGVAGGEAILTGFHQNETNRALAVSKSLGVSQYGSLNEMFNKDKRPHSLAPRLEKGFNRGGFASFKSGGVAEPPGDPGAEVVQAAYANVVGKFLRRFNMDLTQGYNPSGPSVSAGHNLLTAAPSLDVVPLDGNWDGLFKDGLIWAMSQGMQVGYDGQYGTQAWDNHGEGNHAHIDWGGDTDAMGNAIPGAVGRFADMAAAQLNKIKIKGPKGRLKDALQGMADKLRGAANKKLGKYGPTGAGFIPGGTGSVVRQMASVLLRAGLDKEAAAGIIGNALQESGWSTTADDGAGNGGLFGFTAGEKSMASLHAYADRVNKPWDAVDTQVNFMLSTLGSIKSMLNAADSIAETTSIFMNEWERPYIPTANLERRLQGAQQALQIINAMTGGGRKGGGKTFQTGGEVPQFDNGGVVPGPRGSKQLVVAHGGETFIPTHKGMYAKGGPVKQAFQSLGDVTAVFFHPGAADIDKDKDSWRSKWKDAILGAIEDLLRDGGALDDLMTAIEEQINNLSNELAKWSVKVRKGTVAQVRTNKEIAEKTLKNLEKVGESYQDASDEIDEAIKVVQKNINRAKTTKERQKWRAALENLEDRQRELDATISENLQSRLDAQASIFDAITARFDQMLTRVDTMRQILQAKADIASEDVSEEAMARLFRRSRNVLRSERKQIRQELREARKSGDIERARELRQAMLDNKLALLENTQALNDVKDQVQETFSFNTTPWQLFRQAILNGSGGLIPQLSGTIPSLASGGIIARDGLVNLHAGEVVTPANQASGDTYIQITQPMEVADPVALSSEIAWKLKTQT